MKNLLPLFLIALLFLSKPLLSQTQVSGGIYSNTTWTLAQSPYLLTNNLVVFPGATLTIQPGVEVRVKSNLASCNPFYIEARGTINMVGLPNATITFKSETEPTKIGAWTGFIIKNSQGGALNYNYVNISNAIKCFDYDASLPETININQCSFKYNFYAIVVGLNLRAENCTFTQNENAVYGWSRFEFNNCLFDSNRVALSLYASLLSLNNCVISHNNMGITLASSSMEGISLKYCLFEDNIVAFDNANSGTIDSCTFIRNQDAIKNTYYLKIRNSNFSQNTTALQLGFGTEVMACAIFDNGTGVALGPISFGQPAPNIKSNKICYNQLYNIDNRTDLNLFVPTNCFCISDSIEMENKIFDGYDDITKGLISYDVFDTTCTNVLAVRNKTGEPTSLDENSALITTAVYPNPFQTQINIENNHNYHGFQLMTIAGKTLITGELKANDHAIPTDNLEAGTYLLWLKGLDGQGKCFKLIRN